MTMTNIQSDASSMTETIGRKPETAPEIHKEPETKEITGTAPGIKPETEITGPRTETETETIGIETEIMTDPKITGPGTEKVTIGGTGTKEITETAPRIKPETEIPGPRTETETKTIGIETGIMTDPKITTRIMTEIIRIETEVTETRHLIVPIEQRKSRSTDHQVTHNNGETGQGTLPTQNLIKRHFNCQLENFIAYHHYTTSLL